MNKNVRNYKATSILLIVIGLIGYVIFVFNTYTIEPTNQDIQRELIHIVNESNAFKDTMKDRPKGLSPRMFEKEEKPKLLQVKQLGDSRTYIAHFLLGDQTAMALFNKGFNGKLKWQYRRTGDSRPMYDFYCKIKTNEGYYLLISGKREDDSNYIAAKIRDEKASFKLKIPQDQYYLILKKMPKGFDGDDDVDLLF